MSVFINQLNFYELTSENLTLYFSNVKMQNMKKVSVLIEVFKLKKFPREDD